MTVVPHLIKIPEEPRSLRKVPRCTEFKGLLHAELLKVVHKTLVVLTHCTRIVEVNVERLLNVNFIPQGELHAVIVLELEELKKKVIDLLLGVQGQHTEAWIIAENRAD